MPARVLCFVLVCGVAVFGFAEVFAQSDDSPKATGEDWTLERVLAMGRTEIVELWKQCPAATLEEMNGHYVGFIPNTGDPFAKKLTDNFMYNENSERGYWLGKAYKRTSATKGEGYNRWRRPGGKFAHGQRFATEEGASLVDGKPALMMYYQAYNPGMALTDEIRKLADNIYLGIGTTPRPDGTRKLFGHFVFFGPVHEWVEFDGRTAPSRAQQSSSADQAP